MQEERVFRDPNTHTAAPRREETHGWVPPVVFDPGLGRHRVATQGDITKMERQLSILNRLYKNLVGDVDRCRADLRDPDDQVTTRVFATGTASGFSSVEITGKGGAGGGLG